MSFFLLFALPPQQDKEPYKINAGAVSEARLPAVFRVHHNARILCIMEHPTLKVRQNASILLDVQCEWNFSLVISIPGPDPGLLLSKHTRKKEPHSESRFRFV